MSKGAQRCIAFTKRKAKTRSLSALRVTLYRCRVKSGIIKSGIKSDEKWEYSQISCTEVHDGSEPPVKSGKIFSTAKFAVFWQ